MQLDQLARQHSPGIEQSTDHPLEHGIPRDQLAEPRVEAGSADLTNLQTEGSQDAAHPDIEVDTFPGEQFSRGEQSADFLRID